MVQHGGKREGAGRPISEATVRAQEARAYISLQVKGSLKAITAKAISQAIEGNSDARNWLSGYAWGKQAINLGVDENGSPVVGNVIVFEEYGVGKPAGK